MWRKCDLHRHTTPDDEADFVFDARAFVTSCMNDGLDVVAVTDHDSFENAQLVVDAAVDQPLIVVAGAEVSTDRGHIIVLAPSEDGTAILKEFFERANINTRTQTEFDRLMSALREDRNATDEAFRELLIVIGAHVDSPHGSILSSGQAASLDHQLQAIAGLDALEVVKRANIAAWSRGIKQSSVTKAMIQGSDDHPGTSSESRSTWIYLPEVTVRDCRHAFATPEASIVLQEQAPAEPSFWIKSVRFEGGPFDGRHVEFSPRANALIGPPSSGKSLIVDSLRYVFGLPCEITDVQAAVESRLQRCLPDTSSVVVEIVEDGQSRAIRRTRGGFDGPDIRARPIVFSQAELARRAMEPVASVDLLDLHCPDAGAHRQRLARLQSDAVETVTSLVGVAKQLDEHRGRVENEAEGLEATLQEFQELVGDEENSVALNDLAQIERWHGGAKVELKRWSEGFSAPEPPVLPEVPELSGDIERGDYIPKDPMSDAVAAYRATVKQAADSLVEQVGSYIDGKSVRVSELRDRVQALLGTQQQVSPELAKKAEELKERLVSLQGDKAEMTRLESDLEAGYHGLEKLIRTAKQVWMDLRADRQTACSKVNGSMRGFFVRLNNNALTTEVDNLLLELREGTYFHEPTVLAKRDALDRGAFVRVAIGHTQRRSQVGTRGSDVDEGDVLGQIAVEASDREKYSQMAQLVVTWPEDGIELCQKGDSGVPVPFGELTEGLKALAIKEISLAATERPAVTDQPEDAVPTASVYDTLVPTLRSQRRERQFIVASHDANVVVASDVERVIVLPASPAALPIEGSLFVPEIAKHALALLEGGAQAFRHREQRYGEFGSLEVAQRES